MVWAENSEAGAAPIPVSLLGHSRRPRVSIASSTNIWLAVRRARGGRFRPLLSLGGDPHVLVQGLCRGLSQGAWWFVARCHHLMNPGS